MIAEIIGGTILLGSAVSGWIVAFRARGAENDAHGARRIADAKSDAAEARANAAAADAAAYRVELAAAQAVVSTLRSNLELVRTEKVVLLEKLAKAGMPVAPHVLDSAIERLHANAGRVREAPAGNADRADRVLPDGPADALEDPRDEG